MKNLNLNSVEIKASQIPDDMPLMSKLHKAGYLVSTPSSDYDDSYCIQYAKKTGAYIVTNDKFRDYIEALSADHEEQQPKQQRGKPKKKADILLDKNAIKQEQAWIRSHSVSFTFNKDELLPNPDSKIWNVKGCVFEDYRNYPLEQI